MGRRGPKPKDGTRINGRLSRAQSELANRAYSQYDKEEREMLETGLAARERIYGLPRATKGDKGQPVALSRDQRAGSFVGRLCINGELTITQHDAAERWLEQSVANARAKCLPRPPGAVRISDTPGGGVSGEYENIERTLSDIAEFKAAHDAVQAAQYEPSNMGGGSRFTLLSALWHLVEQDIARHDMVADLRIALNVLARHYKIEARKAA
jgi:hypothetical protein